MNENLPCLDCDSAKQTSEGPARSWFVISAAGIFFITGIAKIWAAFGNVRLLAVPDPIIGIELGHLLFTVGIIELGVAIACLCAKSELFAAGLLAWISTNFVAYRIGLWWMVWKKPCSCLGSLTGALHISPQLADNIMKIVLVYLFIGSYGLLIWTQGKRKGANSKT